MLTVCFVICASFSFPGELGWDLVGADSEIVASEHPGTYDFFPILKGVSIVNESVSVVLGEEYTLIVYDTSGDGCKWENTEHLGRD